MKRAICVLVGLMLCGAAWADTFGYDSGSSASVFALPGSSSHATGTSIGGLFTIKLARSNGGSGEVENVTWASTGGATVSLLFRFWDKKPVATCNDGAAYVSSTADTAHNLIQPQVMTVAAPTYTGTDPTTYGTLSFSPPMSFRNQDVTATQNIYACVLALATDTADDSSTVYLIATGPQN